MRQTSAMLGHLWTTLHRFRRAAALLCGAALLIWMGVEDHSAVMPVGFGFVLSAFVVLSGEVRALRRRGAEAALILAGVGIGLGTALTAALLMLLKTGWHGHLSPDFPPGMILDVLARAPLWAASGAFTGLGAALMAHRQHR